MNCLLAKRLLFSSINISGMTALSRWANRDNVIVLTYHSFSKESNENGIPVVEFKKQLDFIKQRYEIVGIDSLITRSENHRQRPRICITVDDGFSDNFDVLKHVDFPVTVFLATDFIDNSRPPWITHIRSIISQSLRTEYCNQRGEVFNLTDNANRNALAEKLKSEIKVLTPLERFEFVERLQRDLGAPSNLPKPLSWQQVKQLAGKGSVRFASHTVFHSNLAYMPELIVREELQESKIKIENELQIACNYVAYPDGSYDEKAKEIALETGYLLGLTQDFGINKNDTDCMEFRRVNVPDNDELYSFAPRIALISPRQLIGLS